jgi:hypothetical protein
MLLFRVFLERAVYLKKPNDTMSGTSTESLHRHPSILLQASWSRKCSNGIAPSKFAIHTNRNPSHSALLPQLRFNSLIHQHLHPHHPQCPRTLFRKSTLLLKPRIIPDPHRVQQIYEGSFIRILSSNPALYLNLQVPHGVQPLPVRRSLACLEPAADDVCAAGTERLGLTLQAVAAGGGDGEAEHAVGKQFDDYEGVDFCADIRCGCPSGKGGGGGTNRCLRQRNWICR